MGTETLDFAIPAGAMSVYMSTLTWSNTAYFDVFLKFGGIWKFHRRVNQTNPVVNANSGGTPAGNLGVLMATGVNHASHIRLQNRKGRIHFTGLGFTREDMAGSYGSGFVHQDSIVAPVIVRGMIIMWTGASAPGGWAICDGQNGTPDLRGRFVLGQGRGAGLTSRGLKQTGGAQTHALTAAQMPSHKHGMLTRQDDYNVSGGTGPSFGKDNGSYRAYNATDSRGANHAHNNMPPFFVLAYIMKL